MSKTTRPTPLRLAVCHALCALSPELYQPLARLIVRAAADDARHGPVSRRHRPQNLGKPVITLGGGDEDCA
jgi:hypothetical protein